MRRFAVHRHKGRASLIHPNLAARGLLHEALPILEELETMATELVQLVVVLSLEALRSNSNAG